MSSQEPNQQRAERDLPEPTSSELCELFAPSMSCQHQDCGHERFGGANIAVRVKTTPGPEPRLDEVCFEVFTSDGEKLATYEAVGPIHPTVSFRVLRYLAEAQERGEPQSHIPLKVYWHLTSSSTIKFRTLPASSAPSQSSDGPVPALYRLIPRLEQVANDSRIIDNQLGAHWITGDIVTRITARLEPKDGYAILAIATSGTDHETSEGLRVKLLAPVDPAMTEMAVRQYLVKQVGEIIVRMNREGSAGVKAYLAQSDSCDWLSCASDPVDRKRIDYRLINESTQNLRGMERELASGAKASLLIGESCAAIVVIPRPSEPSNRYVLKYKLPETDGELTGWHIHYLRKTFDLLTSESVTDQAAGVAMAISQRQPLFDRETLASVSVSHPSLQSLKSLVVSAHGYDFIPECILGHDQAARLSSLVDTEINTIDHRSFATLTDSLRGTRVVSIKPVARGPQREDLEKVRSARFAIFNDSSISVELQNGMNSRLVTVIPAVSGYGACSQETVGALVQLFAGQQGDCWRSFLAAIQHVSDEPDSPSCAANVVDCMSDFPPSGDSQALDMFEEAGRMYSWLLTGHVQTRPEAWLRYCGPGSVELTVEGIGCGPGFQLILERGILREFRLLQEIKPLGADSFKSAVVATFRADSLEVSGAEVQLILDACSLVMHDSYNSILVGDGVTNVSPVVGGLIQILQKTMTIQSSEGLDKLVGWR
jgi:hypothetical protein